MPRIIFKCPYLKPGTKKGTAHRRHYINYIAARDGAEPFTPEKLRENYVGYIAQRPGAERVGAHGLFNGTGDALPLSKIAEEEAAHPGCVWTPILSLRREDADRLGYDNARQWQTFLTSYAPELAEAMKIPWEQFRWYASFHNDGEHPHVHMICYSADGRSGFLSKEGIARIKSGLAKEIFRQELTEIYQRQTLRREELVRYAAQRMNELIRQLRSGEFSSEKLENPRLEQLLLRLSEQLKHTKGKKQYGYLRPPLKALVNEIVDELERDPRIAEAYRLWHLQREEVLRTYRDDLPERLPLSRQKEFRQIRNLVIREAARLEEDTPRLGDPLPLLTCTARLLSGIGGIFREQTPPALSGIRFVDGKLQKKLRQKKIAMGHREDERGQKLL